MSQEPANKIRPNKSGGYVSADGPRAITKAEAASIFVARVKEITKHWAKQNMSPSEIADGIGFSVMSLLDGCSIGFPATEISLGTYPEDEAFCVTERENFFVDGMVINDEVMLHEIWPHNPRSEDCTTPKS